MEIIKDFVKVLEIEICFVTVKVPRFFALNKATLVSVEKY